LSFLPSELESAVNFLGDILTNSLYSPAQIEAEREGIYRESVSTADQFKTVLEAGHFTNYRDHYLG
jgi:processing peptidase subunit beta